MDTNEGQFLSDLKQVNVKNIILKGGIIYDTTNLVWIDRIINSINCSNQNKIKRDDSNVFVDSNATLIICSRKMINIWKNKIEEIIRDSRIINIDSNFDYKKIKYSDIINTDFIIISYEFISSKS